MKILFVFRNSEWLGVEYLSSVLKQGGHETDLVYYPGVGDIEFKVAALEKMIEEKIVANMLNKSKRFAPDIIAFSVLSNLYPWVSRMAKVFKNVFKIPIIAGGIHPTIFPETVISNPYIDIICRGEGEEGFLELADAMKKGKDYFDIRNLWFKHKNKIVRNEMRPLLQNLDSLPFPDKDLFYQYRCFSFRAYVMASRGCPYDCSYCSNHAIRKMYHNKGAYLRRRSVNNVIQELKTYLGRYKIKEIFFYDDIFTLNIEWLKQFCLQYRKEIKLPFKCMIRANFISKETADILKEAGCIYVDMGLESGSERIRNDIMKRNMSDEQILNAGKALHSASLKFNTLNIFGSPTELIEDMKKTVSINRQLKPSHSLANVLYPLPGTEILKILEKNNCIDENVIAQIEREEGSYRGKFILNHPLKTEVLKYQTFLPIVVKLPKNVENLILSLPPWKIFRFISIFFSTNPRNLYIRLKEQIESIYYALFKQ